MPSLLALAASLISLAVSAALAAAPASAAEVSSFSPRGTVTQVRQVAAAFSEPMVAFGAPRAQPNAKARRIEQAGTPSRSPSC